MDTLSVAGYLVRPAKDGREVLNYLDHEEIDLLLLDLRMPNLNGIEVLGILKESGTNIPIIVLSAVTGLKEELLAFEDQVTDFLSKPFVISELLRKVEQAISK
jgi:DNA-binding response OmpR family regulator